MLRNSLCTLLVLFPIWASAQQPVRYEYWFDHDASQRQSGEMSGQEFEELSLDASALIDGMHLVSLRVQDNKGQWSSPLTRYFMNDRNRQDENTTTRLVQYEYWFDHNIAQRQSGELTGQGEVELSLDASALHEGMHLVTFRTQDNLGRWSSPHTRFFMHLRNKLPENKITTLEYWIDNDYAHRQKIVATDGEMMLDIDAQQLVHGVHYLTLRSADSRGQMSSPITRYFLAGMPLPGDNLITAYRYWFNDAAADATMIELEHPQSPFMLDVNLKPNHLIKEGELTDENTTTLIDADGTERVAARNMLHIMFCDTHGNWSQMVNEEFAALPAKEGGQSSTLSNITLLAVDDEQAWRNTGANVGITLSGSYSHNEAQDAQLYYITDNGATRRAETTLKAGEAQFETTIECVFKQHVTEHTLKLFAVDADEIPSDTVIVKIGEMENTHLYDVQDVMTYTGNALEQDDITVYDYSNGCNLSTDQYVLAYADNVNDGYASVWAEGCFPHFMGKSNSSSFRIHSIMAPEEVEVLRQFQQSSGFDGWDLNQEVIYCDELPAVSGYNTHITSIELPSRELKGDLPRNLLALPMLEMLDLRDNRLQGMISHDVITPNLQTLYLSDNCLNSLSGPLPKTVKRIELQGQDLSGDTITYYNALLEPELFYTALPNIMRYRHDTQSFDRFFELYMSKDSYPFMRFSCDDKQMTVINGWAGYGNYAGFSGDLLDMRDDSGNQLKVKFYFDPGDANADGEVDVLDIQSSILYMFDDIYSSFNFTAADTYADRSVTIEEVNTDEPCTALNIQDLVCTTNLLLAAAEARHCMPMSTRSMESPASTDAYLYIEGNDIVLETSRPVAALQLTSTGDVQWQLNQCGLSQTTAHGGADVVAYSLSRNTLPIGRTIIGQCGTGCQFINACLADDEAQRISVTMGQPSVNGIEEIGQDAETMTYGADGVRRQSLQPGINIMRLPNGASIKSYIK